MMHMSLEGPSAAPPGLCPPSAGSLALSRGYAEPEGHASPAPESPSPLPGRPAMGPISPRSLRIVQRLPDRGSQGQERGLPGATVAAGRAPRAAQLMTPSSRTEESQRGPQSQHFRAPWGVGAGAGTSQERPWSHWHPDSQTRIWSWVGSHLPGRWVQGFYGWFYICYHNNKRHGEYTLCLEILAHENITQM